MHQINFYWPGLCFVPTRELMMHLQTHMVGWRGDIFSAFPTLSLDASCSWCLDLYTANTDDGLMLLFMTTCYND